MAKRSTFTYVRAKRLTIAVGLVLLAVAPTAAAQAQPSEAESLFQSGLEEMRKGDYASACPDLAASYGLEPLPGALFTLAECEASWGRVATALKHYQQFVGVLSSMEPARRQKFDDRRHLALEQIATLASSVPLLSINVTPGSPPELVVKRGDTIVAESSYGVETPVDPGELVITAEHRGKTVWQRRVRVAIHERAAVVVPWPAPAASGAVTPGLESTAHGAPSANTTRGSDENKRNANAGSSSLSTWKYITAGVGAAGFTVSVVAGALALAKKGSVDAECPDYHCSASGLDQANSAQRAARISTVGFIVGLAGAAGFTGLSIFGKPKQEQAQVRRLRLAIDGRTNAGELRLEGSF